MDMWGGQSIPQYDFALAPYVLKSYKKHLKRLFEYEITKHGNQSTLADINNVIDTVTTINKTFSFDSIVDALRNKPLNITDINKIVTEALKQTYVDTFQGAESLVHNLNSMASRAGSQVPFSSLNFGLDISPEGRMVTECLLKAQLEGLGKHETAIFPILIFSLKKGVNFEKEDPNYDLFKLAMECSSKRLFPTYAFVDSSFNLPFYEEDPYYGAIAYMGCRTRVMSNINGREGSFGRGNISFTTLNLPMIALKAKGNIEKFYKLLDDALNITEKQLLERYEAQCKNRKYNFPSLMEQHIYLDSENLGATDEIRDVLKHGTLSIGFVGLAECLVALTGKHHGESTESDEIGYNIVKYMREYCDKKTEEHGLNFSVVATPAETYCKTSLEQAKNVFGIIPGVTDKDYFTNSSHVPVWHQISISDKMKVEGKYHKLENAGHIAYVEVDGDISQNLEAFEKILHIMSQNDVGYGAVNIPVIECPVCHTSFRGSSDIKICPSCGFEEE